MDRRPTGCRALHFRRIRQIFLARGNRPAGSRVGRIGRLECPMSDGIRGPYHWLRYPALAILALLLGDLLAAQIVRAASEEAWDALVREASAACQIASELEQPRVVWTNPAYEHQAALIITGKWPQT